MRMCALLVDVQYTTTAISPHLVGFCSCGAFFSVNFFCICRFSLRGSNIYFFFVDMVDIAAVVVVVDEGLEKL